MKKCALGLAAGLFVSAADAATITPLTDFTDFTSPTIVSETGQAINDSSSFTSNGFDCFNVGIGSESGVCTIDPDPLTFDIPGAFEVGMTFGNDDPNFGAFFTAVLSVFDGPAFLGSVSVLSNGNDLVDQFIGLRSDVAFDHVELQYEDVPAPSSATRLVSRVDFGVTPDQVPEPGSLILLGLGIAVAARFRRLPRA